MIQFLAMLVPLHNTPGKIDKEKWTRKNGPGKLVVKIEKVANEKIFIDD